MQYEITHINSSKTNPTLVTLTVKSGSQQIGVDKIDIAKADKRAKFAKDLIKNNPGLKSQMAAIGERLLSLADELLNADPIEDEAEENFETPLSKSKTALKDTDPELVEAAIEFLKSPNLIDLTLQHMDLLGLVGEAVLALSLYLIYSSRLLLKPLSAIVMGSSSSGKSFGISTIAKLFPPEVIYLAHRLTPSAIAYMPPGTLEHRAVVAGERSRSTDDEVADVTRGLREMQGDGVLRTSTVGRDKEGNLQTQLVEQMGPISYVESTTLGRESIFDEDLTRMLLLCCDETEEQSQAVVNRLAIDAMSPDRTEEIETITSLHFTAQRLLQPYDVVIPFASELASVIPTRKPESRRSFGHLLSLIRAVALLHQFQRKRDIAGRIVADVADYDVVKTYMIEPISRGLGVSLTAGADRLLQQIEEIYNLDEKFTPHDLREQFGLGKGVYDRLRELRDHGWVKLTEPGSGSSPGKYALSPYPTSGDGLVLPDLHKNNMPPLSAGKEDTKC